MRVIGVDYGSRRVGLAISDPSKTFAFPLGTVFLDDLFPFLDKYFRSHAVEMGVLGYPMDLKGRRTHATPYVEIFEKDWKKHFPHISLLRIDERLSSKIASQSMVMAGYRVKDRRRKENLDKISATLILQTFLSSLSSGSSDSLSSFSHGGG
ncbi:MAG: Holliday junction resolvase RuvX [Cytophagales bacterium]|nr:Holliday junction resolvase RuvX [Cytophagales bacterium]